MEQGYSDMLFHYKFVPFLLKKIKNKITGENVYPWRNYFKKYMPWQESNFQVWYSTLDIEEKKDYELDRMDKFQTGKIDL